MKLKLIHIAILMFVMFALNASYQISSLTVDDGLSSNSIQTIYKDSDGLLWIGTTDGLNVYDGEKFFIFKHNPKDSNSISDNIINCILEDYLGNIWIGTNFGLNKFNKNTNEFTRFYSNKNKNSLNSNVIRSLYEDYTTTLWIGTDGGLNKYLRIYNYFKNFYNGSNKKASQILSIYPITIEDKPHLLLTTNYGVYRFDKSKESIHYFSEHQDLKEYSFPNAAIEEDHILFSTWGRGLFYLDLKTNKLENITEELGLTEHPLSKIVKINKNEYWVSSSIKGLYRVNVKTRTAEHLNKSLNENSLNSNSIQTLNLTTDGLLWIGTQYGGLNKLIEKQSKNNFQYLFTDYNISSYVQLDKYIYFGTKEGFIIELNTINKKQKVYDLNKEKFLSFSIVINSLYADTLTKTLYISANGIGYFTLKNGQFKYHKPLDLNNNLINDISGFFIDPRNNDLWLLTFNDGIFKYNKKLKQFNSIELIDSKGMTHKELLQMKADNENNLWITSKNSSIIRLNISNPETPVAKFIDVMLNSKANNLISNLIIDKNNFIWIGTIANGLICIDKTNKNKKIFTEVDGLISNTVLSIIEDDSNNLWLAHPKGLTKMNKNTMGFDHFKFKDFLKYIFFNIDVANYKNKTLYFGGDGGIVYFKPDSMYQYLNKSIPPILIKSITLNRKNSKESKSNLYFKNPKKLTIDYKNNDITIEFSALDYYFPEKNSYAYVLEGYDKNWIFAENMNVANYTNLKPGHYVFKVKASNNDQVWNEQGVTLIIDIVPPFYMETWFKLIIILFIFIIAIIGIGIVLTKIRENNKKLEAETEDILFAKENQLKTLIDNIPDFIYIKDKHSRFIVANIKLCRVVKVQSPDELIGKQDHDYYSKNLADIFYDDEQEIMRTGIALINKEELGKDEFGNDIIVSTTKVPVKNRNGETIGLVGIGRDITKIKESERKILEQTEALQETNVVLEERQEEIMQQKEEIEFQRDELVKLIHTKDKLFSIIGHDLRNPFSAIIGLAEYLVIENKNKIYLTHEQLDIVEMIKESATYSHELLENLLQWAKSQTGKLELNPEKINLANIITESINPVKVNAEKKNISIINDGNSEIYIFCDKNMINTAIRNLLSNAIKFTLPLGRITIKTEVVDNEAHINISDTGIGIEENTLKKLFQVNEHITTRGTSGESGTGLGLLLCKEFVESNGGRISAKSIVNQGTTFTIILPLL